EHEDARPNEEDSAAKPRPELEQQDSSDGEKAAHERRRDRAQEEAGAECGNECTDLATRQPLPRADDDEREQQPWADEVREPEEDRARTQGRLAPGAPEALRELRAKRREDQLAIEFERWQHHLQ